MAAHTTLTAHEERLIGHLRRLSKHHKEFKIEVYGSFKQGRRQIQIRPCAYETHEIEDLQTVFDALD